MIKMIVLDVDGTLTDGSIVYSNSGEELKQFNVKDGMGISLANKLGIKISIITGRKSEIVRKRAIELGITDIYQGSNRKLDILENLCSRYGFLSHEIAYIGDDWNDIPCLRFSGLAMCPSDAVSEVKSISGFISEKKGGDGAVRECIDHIFRINEIYEKAKSFYEV